MKKCFALLILQLIGQVADSQIVSSRYGYNLPVKDTIRIFTVFAEVYNDPNYNNVTDVWQPGDLPDNRDEMFDTAIVHIDSIKGYFTRYFAQASYNKYIVLGDYLDTLIQIDFTGLDQFNSFDRVIDKLNTLPGSDLHSKNGYKLSSHDFDRITSNYIGGPKTISGDSYLDFLIIVYRVNSALSTINNSGKTAIWRDAYNIRNLIGSNGYTYFVSWGNDPVILRHEFSHNLEGPNEFHTQGGAGGRKTMSIPGGYGMLSSDPAISKGWNAYDRWRLGWKPANHQYYISARRADDYSEVNSDFINKQLFSGGMDTFVLRDFAKYGDAIRIKLPYLKSDNSQVFDQYLWLENHQQLNGYIDFDEKMNKGIYAYIQIGKNDTSDFDNEKNNYIHLLNSMGNYDLKMELTDKSIDLTDGMENPLTGYSMAMQPGININEPDSIPIKNASGQITGWKVYYNKILGKETLFPAKLKINGQLIPADSFNIETYPIFGSVYDGFAIGSKIGMGSNPPATPVLTYVKSIII